MTNQHGDPLDEVRHFMKSRVILSAAQLDLFTLLDRNPSSAQTLAQTTKADLGL
ncbi:MAG: hypothetical protein ACUVSA_06510 [Desulfosoma sp.]|uniref:hypothetical protein n=1 Tax=Desulfosoma sp. TaxID=2603217 RepID=UPI0040495F8B